MEPTKLIDLDEVVRLAAPATIPVTPGRFFEGFQQSISLVALVDLMMTPKSAL